MESIGAVFFSLLMFGCRASWSQARYLKCSECEKWPLGIFVWKTWWFQTFFFEFSPLLEKMIQFDKSFWNHQLVRTFQILVVSFMFTAFESIENYAGWNSKIVVRELPSYKDLNSRWALASYKCSHGAPIAENKWVGLFPTLELWAPKH